MCFFAIWFLLSLLLVYPFLSSATAIVARFFNFCITILLVFHGLYSLWNISVKNGYNAVIGCLVSRTNNHKGAPKNDDKKKNRYNRRSCRSRNT
jgi:hypothetical protein